MLLNFTNIWKKLFITSVKNKGFQDISRSMPGLTKQCVTHISQRIFTKFDFISWPYTYIGIFACSSNDVSLVFTALRTIYSNNSKQLYRIESSIFAQNNILSFLELGKTTLRTSFLIITLNIERQTFTDVFYI